MTVLLWHFTVETQTLDTGSFEPDLDDIQRESPGGKDNPINLMLGLNSESLAVNGRHTI